MERFALKDYIHTFCLLCVPRKEHFSQTKNVFEYNLPIVKYLFQLLEDALRPESWMSLIKLGITEVYITYNSVKPLEKYKH